MKNLEIIIEIPKDSAIKYEYNRKTKKIHVDRILRNGDKYPTNYGFIPNTLDWDGDELDILLISDHQFIPGASLQARIIGAMKMIDEGETDTKLIGVHADDFALNHIKDLKDLKSRELDKIKHFFLTYKKHKGENVIKIEGFEGYEYAMKELEECTHLMKKYGQLPKDKFIEKMKKEHPEKYM